MATLTTINTETAEQVLLTLVSRGHAVIAEIQRLSFYMPTEFMTPPIPFPDFTFFQKPETWEPLMQQPVFYSINYEFFRKKYLDLVERFYQLFESIYKYQKDLNRFISDLESGIFIQQSLNTLFLTTDGKQLLIESVFLYAVMLLQMNEKSNGQARERLILSFKRWKDPKMFEVEMFEEICKLCAQLEKDSKFPVLYFSRFPINQELVSRVLGKLRTEDVYQQMNYYPLPEHRSFALAPQASMLFLILFFSPDILESDQSQMREIVDRHFPDNWVIAYYMGMLMDISEYWKPFTAASQALENTIQAQNVKVLFQKYTEKIPSLNLVLTEYLTEGLMTREYVLENIQKLLLVARDANTTLRWLLLHLQTKNTKISTVVKWKQLEGHLPLLELILNISQFEFQLKNHFQWILKEKQQKWDQYKKQGSERMQELSDYFSGTKVLTRVKRNPNLESWFSNISKQIQNLDFSDSTAAGRKIIQFDRALEEIQEFHQLDSNLQIKVFISDTRQFLGHQLRLLNAKEDVLVTLNIVTDFSFSWEMMAQFIPFWQQMICKAPEKVLKMRCFFLKLCSILELPLIRINQANSPDLLSVSQFYSKQLVQFVERIIQILPNTIFGLLNQIIQLETFVLKPIPNRVELKALNQLSQYKERLRLSKLQFEISKLSEALFLMQKTLVGVIEIEPKKLLERGLRQELRTFICFSMIQLFQMTSQQGSLMDKFQYIHKQILGLKKGFESIQDHVGMYCGLIWEQEIQNILNAALSIEMEKVFGKVQKEEVDEELIAKLMVDSQKKLKLPKEILLALPQLGHLGSTFLGRLLLILLNHSDFSRYQFDSKTWKWSDPQSNQDQLSLQHFRLLVSSIGPYLSIQLQKLLGRIISESLLQFMKQVEVHLSPQHLFFLQVFQPGYTACWPPQKLPNDALMLYNTLITKTNKLLSPSLTSYMSLIGQCLVLSTQLHITLQHQAQIKARFLSQSLSTVNQALLKDFDSAELFQQIRSLQAMMSNILPQNRIYLDCSLFVQRQVQLNRNAFQVLAFFMFIFCLSKKESGILIKTSLECFWKHFHRDVKEKFKEWTDQYSRAFSNLGLK